MLTARISKLNSAISVKHRTSRPVRHACFTLKRPLVFQVRKSLVEYVDEELLKMDTSVFYQRIFILAKNVEPKHEDEPSPEAGGHVVGVTQGMADGETATLRTAENMMGDDEHYSQKTTPEGSQNRDGDSLGDVSTTVRIAEPDPDVEIVTRTYRFEDWDNDGAEAEEELPEPPKEQPEVPKDIFSLFTDKLNELHRKCRGLSYTTDPMCGLVIYMNEYTLMMLESGEDMMGIFCGKLLECIDEYWQSNRVFLIEDHIKEMYTKELLFRRIPAVYLNEKFPPSTPTDEYLMGKQHLIIKDKLYRICTSIAESMQPQQTIDGSQSGSTFRRSTSTMGEASEMDFADEDEERSQFSFHSQSHRASKRMYTSEMLSPDIYRKLLPEIQRIELVLASTRFYYTLDEFHGLYGKVPFGRDDDSKFWPIQNNYAPPNIFRRTPYDINLTFEDYAAEMNQRMQEEQEKNKAELEAAAEAEASAAAQDQPQARAERPQNKDEGENN